MMTEVTRLKVAKFKCLECRNIHLPKGRGHKTSCDYFPHERFPIRYLKRCPKRM